MQQARKTLTRLTIILGMLCPLHACSDVPKQYAAEAIEASVVDAETKKPLEGVVVTANWQLEEGTLGGNRSAGQLMVMEAVTDKNGRFAFPAWGPKWIWKGFLVNADPKLLLFKSGYEYRELYNEYSGAPELRTRKLRYSDWNGKTIVLKPFRETLAKYKEHFEDLNSALEHITTDDPNECYWKKIPKMIRAMNRERERLIAQGVNPHTLSSIDKELLMNDKYFTEKGGCGSPKTFFGDIQ